MNEPPPDHPEQRDAPPWVMEDMIAEEPTLPAGIAGQTDAAERIAEAVRAAITNGRPVAVVGCGTSEHGAMAVAELLRDALGPATAIHPRQAFEAALDPWPGGLCIAISHEGETAATIAAIRAARDSGATTAVITAAPDSAAANEADMVLATPLLDRSWCHTVGYLSPVLAGGLIAGALGDKGFDAAAAERTVRAGLELRPAAEATAERLHGVRQVIVAGSGADRIAARELGLKISEGVRLPAAGFDLETVLHGYLAGHDSETGFVAIVTDPRKRERRAARAEQALLAARRIGVRTAAVASFDSRLADEATNAGRLVTTAPAGVLDSLLASSMALQVLTVALIHAAGVNPDRIRRDDPAYRDAAAIAEGDG